MKYLPLLFVLLCQPCFANEYTQACEHAEEYASMAMETRQHGLLDKAEYLGIVNKQLKGKTTYNLLLKELMQSYIEAAYSMPRFDNETAQQYAVSEFKSQAAKQCYRLMLEDSDSLRY